MRRLLTLVAVCSTAVSACGGEEFSGTEDAGGGRAGQAGSAGGGAGGTSGNAGSGGAGRDGGAGGPGGTGGVAGAAGSDSGVVTRCPPEPPLATDACRDGLECTYGDDMRWSCRDRWTCAGEGWVGTPTTCPELQLCVDLPSGVPHIGSACDPADPACLLSGGVLCTCSPCAGATCPDTHVWYCIPPPGPPCPASPPNEGQPCMPSGKSCKYGHCDTGDFLRVSCEDGFWSWSAESCPSG